MGSRVRSAAAVVTVVLAVTAGGCQESVQFTQSPPIGPPPPIGPAAPTTLFVGIPVELSGVARRVDALIPERIATVVEWVGNAACSRRGNSAAVACTTARVDAVIGREGPVALAVRGERLLLHIPLAYALTSRGVGWAGALAESTSGQVMATASFDVSLTPGLAPTVRLSDEIVLSAPVLGVLDGQMAISKHVVPRLRRLLAPSAEALGTALAAVLTRDRVEQAWRALHAPVTLDRELRQWLRAEPLHIAGGGFATVEGEIIWRLAVSSRLQVFTGERPNPLLPRPLPEVSEVAPERQTRLPLPVLLSSAPLLSNLRAAFPPGEVIRAETSDGVALGVAVRNLAVLPSRGQLSIEVQLEILEPEAWVGLQGAAHFVGLPVVRPEAGLLQIDRIGLAGTNGRLPARGPGLGTIGRSQGPRIAPEPFVGRLAAAARMDLALVLRDALPHVNSLFERPHGSAFVMRGRFDEVRITAVAPVMSGFEVTFEFKGGLLLAPAERASRLGVEVTTPGLSGP
jgi:hypothetical protein